MLDALTFARLGRTNSANCHDVSIPQPRYRYQVLTATKPTAGAQSHAGATVRVAPMVNVRSVLADLGRAQSRSPHVSACAAGKLHQFWTVSVVVAVATPPTVATNA